MGGSVVDRGSVFGRRPGQTLRQNQVTLSHIHLSASVGLPALVQRELSFGRRWGNQQIHSAGGVKKKMKKNKRGQWAHAEETVEGRVAQCD